MKDARGYEYQELLDLQDGQMRRWAEKLNAQVWKDLAPYVLACNRPAETPEDKHRVYRGQDLVQLILDWPNPGHGYEPRVFPQPSDEGVL